ncbi:MAG TPA: phosphoribosylglycinamide formyltransferase [Chitinophagaceae bacterium]|nr:phosphoribosylglycinamide formyltransferase [Chitinophagaceae bacterium]
MFEKLQKKWGVSPARLVLILITFAVGGSLTGYLGKFVMSAFGIRNAAVYVPVYIIVVTIIWPFMVLLVSVFTGQFVFFKNYLAKMGRRFAGNGKQQMLQAVANRQSPKAIAVFASGAGSNAQQIINHFRNSPVARVVLIVCNKQGAGVIDIASKENIPLLMIKKERFFKEDGYLPELTGANIDLVVLAGFLWKIPQALIDAFPRRIINIHPALLPKYGGKGMYGAFVHQAVILAGEMQSGITIHYVDEHYDNGDIIFQTGCPVVEGDTAETLATRVHQLEHLHYPRVVEEVVSGLGG